MADEIEKEIEERVKYREKLCATIQNDVTALAMKTNKLLEHDLETYQKLIEPDCLFNDSPISQFWTHHWLKQYMIKKDMDFIGYVLDGKQTVKNFVEKAQEASKWILRFTKTRKAQKTGLDAIL